MKKLGYFLFALLLFIVIAWGVNNSSAHGSEDCFLDVRGTLGVTICGGQPIDSVQLPTVTLTETVVKTVTDTVTKSVPGPTQTVTVPGPTVTMGPPAPNTTIFQPGKTATVFIPRQTVTVRATPDASVGPYTAPPETRFAQPATRQDSKGRATMKPDKITPFTIDIGDGDFTTAEAAVSLATLLALGALILAGMYAGYYIGYKDSEREDTNFMRALLDEAKIRRGKHS
jgi:hypothetical protein